MHFPMVALLLAVGSLHFHAVNAGFWEDFKQLLAGAVSDEPMPAGLSALAHPYEHELDAALDKIVLGYKDVTSEEFRARIASADFAEKVAVQIATDFVASRTGLRYNRQGNTLVEKLMKKNVAYLRCRLEQLFARQRPVIGHTDHTNCEPFTIVIQS